MRYSDDHSLFVWKIEDQQLTPGSIYPRNTGLLAPSPDCFRSTGNYREDPDWDNNRPYQLTNKGVAIDLRLLDTLASIW